MPVTWGIQGSVLRIECVGEYEPEDITNAFRAAMENANTPMRVALLLDVSRSLSLKGRTPDQIRYVAEFLQPYVERISARCAVVVGATLDYGFSRMGSAYSAGIGVTSEIFRDSESALEWLGAANPTG